MVTPLFFNPRTKHYYTSAEVFCSFCGCVIDNNFYYSIDLFKRGVREFSCCNNKKCLREARKHSPGLVGHRLVVICDRSSDLMVSCEPVVFDFGMVNARSFDVSVQPRDDVSRLRFAGRESWEGASVGLIDSDRLRELDDPALADVAVKKLLEYREVRR